MRAIQTFTAPPLSPRADHVLEMMARYNRERATGATVRTLVRLCRMCQECVKQELGNLAEQGRVRAVRDGDMCVRYWAARP